MMRDEKHVGALFNEKLKINNEKLLNEKIFNSSFFIFNSRKAAFTLAEVLITLSIIGVIAAFTLPTLIQKTAEQRTIAQLAKVYSTLSQAWQRMETEYGTTDTWGMANTSTGEADENGKGILDTSGPNLIKNRLSEYMKVISKENKLDGEMIYNLDGGETFKLGTDPYFVLADGTVLDFGWYVADSNMIEICAIFPNNKNKVHGKSVFYFQAYPNRIVPDGAPNTTYVTTFDNYCNKNGSGRGCTAWVLYNKNMDYLHCRDELSWDGKHKCN